MDAGSLILTLVSLVVGAVLSVIVSRYYFKRSLNYRLSVYTVGASRVLAGIDPDIRRELSVTFRKVTVEQLTTIDLLVANEGVHSIKDVVRPLTIDLPKAASLVDASVPFVYPEGRDVQLHTSSNSSSCNFDILNPDEYFVVKLLISGDVRPKDLECRITAENLAPRIAVRGMPNYISEEKGKGRLGGADIAGLIVGSILLLLGTSCLVAVGWAYEADKSIPFMPHHRFNYLALTMIPSGLLGVFLCIAGFVWVAAESLRSVLPSRRKTFRVPHTIMRGHRRMIYTRGDIWE